MVGSEVTLPQEGATARFINFNNKYKAPFAIYADLESTTKEITSEEIENADGSYTKNTKNTCATVTVFMLFRPFLNTASSR